MSPADSVATPARNFSFAVDRGGTFTDVVATVVGADGVRRTVVEKLLSVDPSSYSDAPTEGIRRILESETGVAFPRGVPIDTSRVAEIRMGTTVATNALLERKGERFALVVTKGFRDVLHIGNQSRPRIFDLEIRCPESLYSEVMEVDELVSIPLDEAASSRSGAAASPRPSLAGTRVTGTTGEALVVRTAPDAAVVEGGLRALRASGYTAVAVLLKHAALYPAHELLVGRIAISLGFTHVSLSHQVLNSVKMVPRGHTACADAYLTPRIREYLAAFTSGFDAGLSSGAVRLSFQMSDGALATASAFSGHRAILSGPAGGVVGYAATTQWEGTRARDLQIVGFDMGGTSTDVSRVAGGEMERVFETTTAGVSIAAPQLDVNTVAAGGGSALALKLGLFAVGPASVGAHPGPVCYKKGGRLAVTDANLQLGRIQPAFFPHIFGADEKQPLDEAATRAAFVALAARVNLEAAPSSAPMSVDEARRFDHQACFCQPLFHASRPGCVRLCACGERGDVPPHPGAHQRARLRRVPPRARLLWRRGRAALLRHRAGAAHEDRVRPPPCVGALRRRHRPGRHRGGGAPAGERVAAVRGRRGGARPAAGRAGGRGDSAARRARLRRVIRALRALPRHPLRRHRRHAQCVRGGMQHAASQHR